MPPMKIEEFRSWIRKKYNGTVRIITDGTDKASEEGHTYCREFLFYMVFGKKIYYNTRTKVKDKAKHDSRFMIELRNNEWYLIDYKAAMKYTDVFVNCVVEDMLK